MGNFGSRSDNGSSCDGRHPPLRTQRGRPVALRCLSPQSRAAG
jgi:hypothetical protein